MKNDQTIYPRPPVEPNKDRKYEREDEMRDDERAKFETWCEKRYPLAECSDSDDDYSAGLWAAWNAALAAQRPATEDSPAPVRPLYETFVSHRELLARLDETAPLSHLTEQAGEALQRPADAEQLFAWTEPTYPLPAYVNLTREGDAWKLSVRTRGQQYASVIELTNQTVDSLSFWLLRPELVSDEESDRAGEAIRRAIERSREARRTADADARCDQPESKDSLPEPVATFHILRLDANTSRHWLEWHDAPNGPGDYPLFAAPPPRAKEKLREAVLALRELCKVFPTDSDMAEAGWNPGEIDAACKAYDEARALLDKEDPAC